MNTLRELFPRINECLEACTLSAGEQVARLTLSLLAKVFRGEVVNGRN